MKRNYNLKVEMAWAVWSSGMILASGARGPGADVARVRASSSDVVARKKVAAILMLRSSLRE